MTGIDPAALAAFAFGDPARVAGRFAAPALLPALRATRLLPFLAHRARARGYEPHRLLGENGAAAVAAARATLARNLLLFAALDRAHAALAASGIRHAALKGAALVASGIYPLAARPMHDADLLVARCDFAASAAALAAAGFRAAPEGHGEVVNFAGDAGENLGLHCAPLPSGRYFGPAYACPAEPLLHRAATEGGSCRLEPTDLLFHLTAHLILCHGFDGPVQMLDIALFTARHRARIDGDRLATHLSACGALPAAAALYRLLERAGFGPLAALLPPRARNAAAPFHRLAAAAAFRLAFTRHAPRLHRIMPWLFAPEPRAARRMAAAHLLRRRPGK